MKEVIELLKQWEKWEGDFIMDDKVWENGLPKFTQKAMDDYIDVQGKRNALLEKLKEMK